MRKGGNIRDIGKQTRFQEGNPGKLEGTVSHKKQDLAAIMRETLEENLDSFVEMLTDDNKQVRLKAWQIALNRAYGAVPKIVKLGLEDDGPLALLAAIQAKRMQRELDRPDPNLSRLLEAQKDEDIAEAETVESSD